ncbi:MAG: D-alanyl-D-alanine carboxypeptidase family protein [Bacteroidota bacterium]|nr:D-alanyl-D-alanine carboxypeptidase family protein [Bacteroidota bacterium]
MAQVNKPIELWSSEVIDNLTPHGLIKQSQKVDFIHNNPVVSGFVSEPWHWRYSSAIDYSGGKGILEIDYI